MSMSLPNPSQPRRPKTILSPDGTTAKFLYTIIKQLDLKAIDWNEVASHLDITNGHAARMRYSRFKAQIEGTLKEQKPKPRVSDKDARNKPTEKSKRGRISEVISKSETKIGAGISMSNHADEPPMKRVKAEGGQLLPAPESMIKSEVTVPLSNTVKIEPDTKIHHPTITKYTVPLPNSPLPKPRTTTEQTFMTNPKPNIVSKPSQSSKLGSKPDTPRASQVAPFQGKHRNRPATQPRMQYQQYQLGPRGYHQPYFPQPAFQSMGNYGYPSHLAPNVSAQYYPSPYPYHQPPRPPYQQSQYGQMPRSAQPNATIQHDTAPMPISSTPSNTRELAAAAASYPWPYSESMIPKSGKPLDGSTSIVPTVNTSNVVSDVVGSNSDIDFDVFGAGLAGDFSDWVMSGDLIPQSDITNTGSVDASTAAVTEAPPLDEVINCTLTDSDCVTISSDARTSQQENARSEDLAVMTGTRDRVEAVLENDSVPNGANIALSHLRTTPSASSILDADAVRSLAGEGSVQTTAKTLAQTHISPPSHASTSSSLPAFTHGESNNSPSLAPILSHPPADEVVSPPHITQSSIAHSAVTSTQLQQAESATPSLPLPEGARNATASILETAITPLAVTLMQTHPQSPHRERREIIVLEPEFELEPEPEHDREATHKIQNSISLDDNNGIPTTTSNTIGIGDEATNPKVKTEDADADGSNEEIL